MSKFSPKLHYISFEIRYAFGHLYWDKCGQTLLDVERTHPEWIAKDNAKQTGQLERIDKHYNAGFSNDRFIFSVDYAHENDINEIAKEINDIWKIVQANLGIDEITRIGLRTYHLLPTESTDEGDELITKSSYNVCLPDFIKKLNLKIKTTNISTVFTDGETQIRVNLAAVTRSKSIDPTSLIHENPKNLSKNQNIARKNKLKILSKYKADPMFAVQLDTDCAQNSPENILVKSFIKEQIEYIEENFLPILEEL